MKPKEYFEQKKSLLMQETPYSDGAYLKGIYFNTLHICDHLDKLEKERLEILEGAIHVEGKPEKIDKKGKK